MTPNEIGPVTEVTGPHRHWMLRYTISFTGTVQGVGFRYTTINVAANHNVTGWVRNESDGSVRCVAEGDQSELDRFVKAVQRAMSQHIRETSIEQSPATGEFSGFHVRR
jgi:acylphosphatase